LKLKLENLVTYLYLLQAFALRNHVSSTELDQRATFSVVAILQMSKLQRHNPRAFHSTCLSAPSQTVFPLSWQSANGKEWGKKLIADWAQKIQCLKIGAQSEART